MRLTAALAVLFVSLAQGLPASAVDLFTLVSPDMEAGEGPVAIVLADLNHDGIQDLAIADSDAGTMNVLIGVGDGTFNPAVPYQAGSSPSAIAVADFNSDTFPDVVVTDEGEDLALIYLNTGDGTFGAEPIQASTGVSPVSVVAADFDGDEFIDLATADNLDDTVTVQLGTNDGRFADAQAIGVGFEPQGLTAADLNGDGKLDLVVTNSSGGPDDLGSLTLLENVGGAVFDILPEVESETLMYPYSVYVADLNRDLKPDLVVVNNEDEDLSIFLGTANFAFAAPTTFTVGGFPESAAVSDFDGDSFLDIATTNYFDDNISVLTGLGNGSFNDAVNIDVGTGPRGISLGKVDADEKLDLVTANQDDGTISVLINQAMAGPTPTPMPIACVGDCNASTDVTVDEILTMVNIALGNQLPSGCLAGDSNNDHQVTVDEILQAVNNALTGCA